MLYAHDVSCRTYPYMVMVSTEVVTTMITSCENISRWNYFSRNFTSEITGRKKHLVKTACSESEALASGLKHKHMPLPHTQTQKHTHTHTHASTHANTYQIYTLTCSMHTYCLYADLPLSKLDLFDLYLLHMPPIISYCSTVSSRVKYNNQN